MARIEIVLWMFRYKFGRRDFLRAKNARYVTNESRESRYITHVSWLYVKQTATTAHPSRTVM